MTHIPPNVAGYITEHPDFPKALTIPPHSKETILMLLKTIASKNKLVSTLEYIEASRNFGTNVF